jgi:predicted nucleic acid-binding protein
MSRVLLDSNVLLRILAKNDLRHSVADRAVVAALRSGHELHLAPQVIMESWVVLTRPLTVNGFGWPPSTVHETLTGAMARFPLLLETPDVFTMWWGWVHRVGAGVRGKRAHDLRLASLMRVHGLRYVLTFNVDDFAGLDEITAIPPDMEIPT